MVSRFIVPTGSVRPLYTRPHIIQSVSIHKPASRKADSPLDPEMLGLGHTVVSRSIGSPISTRQLNTSIDGSLPLHHDWIG